MPKDKTENHEKIIAAAYDEFMKYGFNDASMRRIAAACDMSASGLYKHFPSKEDMFAVLVEPAYAGLKDEYGKEVIRELESIDESFAETLWAEKGETAWVMEYIYDNFKAFKLLVCKSQGTRFEDYVHELALLEEKSTGLYMDKVRKVGGEVYMVPSEEFHMFMTTCINAIFLAVEHDLSRKEAMEYAHHLDVFFEAGWGALFKFK